MVGRNLWKIQAPSEIQELVAQDCVQLVFQYFQLRRLHDLFGQPEPVALKVKKCFLMFTGNLLQLSLCLLPLSLGITEKSLGPPSLYPPFWYLYTLKFLLSLLFRLNSPSSLSAFPHM